MTLLEQASALLAEDGPFTLAQAKALDALCEMCIRDSHDGVRCLVVVIRTNPP